MGTRPLSRRTLLGVTAGSAALLTGGCATTEQAQPAALPPAPAGGTLIMIIRHAEKPAGSGTPQGIDVDGNADPHSLTVAGWTRAGALVELFAPGAGSVRAGLGRPTAIYAAGGTGGEGRRPRETVSPLAARLGLPVTTTFAKGGETALAAEAARRSGVTLISWQHEEIPALTEAFGTVNPAPPHKWPDNRFDIVWILAPAGAGWSFTQVPQLLLAGDSADPIR
ncbi:hypothetical protein [Amycolatopsis australiensis]|uniref:Histidine phosphatase superfamily (Branch 1) n=1 Tax=Amycolatopsis australiensis TaxID=546364 RepID=A0A1K1SR67_9PSEU|nr:hypothetical protein [Amycolatopsis australiensis]SFW86373.1 hypothetical protein SAMN04489730_6372 [Amycolatopsis australiensis]